MRTVRVALAARRYLLGVVLLWAVGRAITVTTVLVGDEFRESGFLVASTDRGWHLLAEAWDAGWYRQVANQGYYLADEGPSTAAFLPGLPSVIWASDGLFGSTAITWVIVVAIGLVGLLLATELAAQVTGDQQLAARAATYMALWPGSTTLAMTLSEGLAIALSAGAALALLRRFTVVAAILGLALGLTRPQGFLLVLPLLAIALRGDRRRAATGAALAPAAGFAAFLVYEWIALGDPLAYVRASERGWGRATGLDGLRATFESFGPFNLRDMIAAAVCLGALAVCVRRLPLAWIAYGAAAVVLPLTGGTFDGSARYSMLALPAFWALAVLGRRPAFDGPLRAFAVAGLTISGIMLPFRAP